jgi:cytochrome b6-f complex iron-sulfur subunit
MSDDTPETPAPTIVPPTGEAPRAAVTAGSPAAGTTASAPPGGANPAATPRATTTPPARPAPAAATPAAAAHGATAARPAPAPKPPAAPAPDLTGLTTTVASPGGAAAKAAAPARAAVPAPAKTSKRDADDTSPLLTRRAWMGLAWGTFTAASAAALAATGRFMFPNVLNEPPQQFKAGFPTEYGPGVDERWKEKFGVWIVRTPDDVVARSSGFYALLVTCTHLGCTPNYLSAEAKFKCPCHGSGFIRTGINVEGPAPRPLERFKITMADDKQILIDKNTKYQEEKGQWALDGAYLPFVA